MKLKPSVEKAWRRLEAKTLASLTEEEEEQLRSLLGKVYMNLNQEPAR
jgi:DNA-binding MarR family transcriptional regulator